MIPNEKLQEISNIKLKNVFELQEYLKSFKITDIADMAQDLLDLRKEKQLLIENSERLAAALTVVYLRHLENIEGEAAKIIGGLINQHEDLMKQVKGE
jgi:hypothetical protein